MILDPNDIMNTKKKTGTREWSDASYNIQVGCEHGCHYCYAREIAKRFRRIASFAEWSTPKRKFESLEDALMSKDFPGLPRYRRVMFPTAHDITPANLQECKQVIERLLLLENHVLIVSKPHLKCVRELAVEFSSLWDRIEFRFSIGSLRDATLKLWEPGATSAAHAALGGLPEIRWKDSIRTRLGLPEMRL